MLKTLYFRLEEMTSYLLTDMVIFLKLLPKHQYLIFFVQDSFHLLIKSFAEVHTSKPLWEILSPVSLA